MKKIMAIIITVFIISCSPSTIITGSWKNPKALTKSYKNVLVVALTGNNIARATIENNVASVLMKNGAIVSKGMEIIPPDFTQDKPDKEILLNKVQSNGVEGILTISLNKKETESRYVPGYYGYEPMARFSYYGDFWGYYNFWYPYYYNPGYYAQDEIYYWETNFYDVQTEALLWSAQSETYNPESLTSFSKEFAEIIVKELKQNMILP